MNSLFPRTLAAVSACLFVLGASGAWAHGDGHTMAGAHRASMPDASGLPASTTMTARDCWVRMLPAPAPSGGFLLIHNGGDQPVAIRGASSPDYGMVMLHQTTEENGLSKMSMVDEIEIPVGQDFELK
ncbi:MAG TPA: copper chaperone PCu(A)C, partial [Castellaniella sp.]|nr:copper chaperone PCu(A)C [Castellaniella sp.]